MRELSSILNQMKRHRHVDGAGMILIHNGIVRKQSANGKTVSGLDVYVDWKKVDDIISEMCLSEGILDIQVEIREGQRIPAGSDLMYLLVMGDIREHIIPVLDECLNRIKTEALKKKEHYQ